ncbi:major facilitator superfamily domain-containing protein, partial [Bisporella sp. PMI_857]
EVAEITESEADSMTWTEDDETRIRRRLDLYMMPIIFGLYLLFFTDRSNIGNARIQGMGNDLQLVGYRFNWTLTIFFISYALVEVPSNLALRIIGGRIYIPILVVSFGMVSICTAFVNNFGGLMTCRFMLGVAE